MTRIPRRTLSSSGRWLSLYPSPLTRIQFSQVYKRGVGGGGERTNRYCAEVVRINTNELNNSGSVYKSELQLQSVDFWVINYWTNDGFDKNTKPLLLKVLQKFFHPSTGTMYVKGRKERRERRGIITDRYFFVFFV